MREIVGVVGNVKHLSLRNDDSPEMYLPRTQIPFDIVSLVVRTSVSDPAALTSAVRKELAAMDSAIPLTSVRVFDEYISRSLARPRFNAFLLSIFAGTALASHCDRDLRRAWPTRFRSAQTKSESASRSARRNRPSSGLIVGQAMTLVGISLAIGLIRSVRRHAFAQQPALRRRRMGSDDVRSPSFSSYAAVAFLAAWLPARRAARVDPVVALCAESDMNDLKLAFRQLRKSPGFTLVAVLTLALGIGANTAIFSVVESVLLRPLPFPRAEQLVRIYEALNENGARSASLNLSDRTVARFREFGREIFEDVAGGTGGAAVVGVNGGSPVQTVPVARITSNFFDVLGLPPAQGRNFTAEEGLNETPSVAIVSDDFWRNALNSRRDVLGSAIVIDGTPRTIIGVMPKAFRHPYRANLWLPLALQPDNPATINNHYLYGVARLRPGVTPEKAEDAVKRMCATINRDDPNPANARAAYMPRRARELRNGFASENFSDRRCCDVRTFDRRGELCRSAAHSCHRAGRGVCLACCARGEQETTRQATAHPGALARFHRDRARSAHCNLDYTNAVRA